MAIEIFILLTRVVHYQNLIQFISDISEDEYDQPPTQNDTVPPNVDFNLKRETLEYEDQESNGFEQLIGDDQTNFQNETLLSNEQSNTHFNELGEMNGAPVQELPNERSVVNNYESSDDEDILNFNIGTRTVQNTNSKTPDTPPKVQHTVKNQNRPMPNISPQMINNQSFSNGTETERSFHRQEPLFDGPLFNGNDYNQTPADSFQATGNPDENTPKPEKMRRLESQLNHSPATDVHSQPDTNGLPQQLGQSILNNLSGVPAQSYDIKKLIAESVSQTLAELIKGYDLVPKNKEQEHQPSTKKHDTDSHRKKSSKHKRKHHDSSRGSHSGTHHARSTRDKKSEKSSSSSSKHAASSRGRTPASLGYQTFDDETQSLHDMSSSGMSDSSHNTHSTSWSPYNLLESKHSILTNFVNSGKNIFF